MENEVAYMADDLGLHRMSNKGSDFAVSLHCKLQAELYFSFYTILMNLTLVYTPPHVAKKGCYIFDEKTGRRKHVPGHNYHSVYGRVLDKGE